jgi:hypothetical protein
MSTNSGGYHLCAPSTVGPQADTFSREREKVTEAADVKRDSPPPGVHAAPQTAPAFKLRKVIE